MFVAALAGAVLGQKAGLAGQASGWLALTRDTLNQVQAGVRYVPSLSLSLPPRLDAELSVNGFASAQARPTDSIEADARVRPYRLWARFSTARFEARAGLQKINFGSATLLRPLMWFDRIDPRDPLALTDGVYGLLGRYYFQNNANVWAWGLLGNSVAKGWEAYGSDPDVPEFGGRVQLPVPRGEVGITGHHRTASVVWGDMPTLPPDTCPAAESRMGLDGKWDVGVGLCFEVTVGKMSSSHVPFPWQRMETMGLDYTFGLGSGLGVLAEHLVFDSGAQAVESGQRGQLSALMLGLPLGLVDNLRGFVYFDWKGHGLYRFLSWQRTLDNWIFNVAAFWNPDQAGVVAGQPASGAAAGKGLQLMVVFNH